MLETPRFRFHLMTASAGSRTNDAGSRLFLSLPSGITGGVESELPHSSTAPSERQTPRHEPAVISPTEVPSEFQPLVPGNSGESAVDPLGVPNAVPLVLPNLLPVVLPDFLLPDLQPDPEPPLSPSLPPLPPPNVKPVVRIGGRIEQAVPIATTVPEYPYLARKAGVEGTVMLKGIVTLRGEIDEIEVVSGHPLLVDAAIQCIRVWRYHPAKLNGEAVVSPIEIQVRFVLKRA